jgi:hypothetical protein
MKVLGIAGGSYSDKKYVVEVGHTEIEKLLDLYYGKKKPLEVGDEIDLAAGYEWDVKIGKALREMQEFVTTNKPIIENLLGAYSVLARIGPAGEKEKKGAN